MHVIIHDVYCAYIGGKPSGFDGVFVAKQNRRQLAPDQASAHRRHREQTEHGKHERAVRHRTAVLQNPRANLRTGKGDRVGATKTRSRSTIRQSDKKQRPAA